ncbi:MAG: hypothetical protein IPK97_08265 [Ahniella sp.]|nr:hypothetical protein [Ahniella sp.]
MTHRVICTFGREGLSLLLTDGEVMLALGDVMLGHLVESPSAPLPLTAGPANPETPDPV